MKCETPLLGMGFLQRSSVDVLALVNVGKINENEKIRSTRERGGGISSLFEKLFKKRRKRGEKS